MKFRLGSMTFGEILDRGIKVLFARLITFYVVALILTSPLLIFQLSVPFLGPDAVMIAMVVAFVLAIVFTFVNAGAVVYIIGQEHIGRPVGAGRAITFALKRFGDLFVTSFMIGLVIFLGAIIGIVVMVIFWAIHPLVGAVVGYVIILAWAIYFALRYSLSTQVVMMEGKGGGTALGRSKELTFGYRGRIFGFWLVSIILGAAVVYAVNYALGTVLPPFEVVQTRSGAVATFNVPNYMTMQVIDFFIQTLFSTYGAICLTLAYFDIRVRKEAFDLELVARSQPGADVQE